MNGYQTVGGSIGAGTVPAQGLVALKGRAPAVPVALESIGREVENLHQIIAEMESRLTPVLAPPAPQAVESNQKDMSSQGLVAALDMLRRQIQGAVVHLHDLRERLEV